MKWYKVSILRETGVWEEIGTLTEGQIISGMRLEFLNHNFIRHSFNLGCGSEIRVFESLDGVLVIYRCEVIKTNED